jgi:hypothetical protein
VQFIKKFRRGLGGKYGREDRCMKCKKIKGKATLLPKERTSTWRTKFTKEQHEERERVLLKRSDIYRWLREEEELSKRAICRNMGLRMSKLYETFYYPYHEMRVRHIFNLSDMLPRKTLFDIMKGINSEFKKQWYEMDTEEEDKLESYFKKFEKRD